MSENYLDDIFEEDKAKMVRDYIFYLDSKRPDQDQYGFDKDLDYVKIHSMKADSCNLIVTYQIIDSKTKKVRFFETPVEMKIRFWDLWTAVYASLKMRK